MHQDIRVAGKGLFSLWDKKVLLSASDNSDCNKNGRQYQIAVLDEKAIRESYSATLPEDDKLLELMIGNTPITITASSIAFSTVLLPPGGSGEERDPISRRHPGNQMGKKPFTAIRFMLKGTERYIANDLFEVRLVQHRVRRSSQAVMPDGQPHSGTELDKVFVRDGDAYIITRLYSAGCLSFDELVPTGEINFIYSTSVLEHVKEPEKNSQMFDILPLVGTCSIQSTSATTVISESLVRVSGNDGRGIRIHRDREQIAPVRLARTLRTPVSR